MNPFNLAHPPGAFSGTAGCHCKGTGTLLFGSSEGSVKNLNCELIFQNWLFTFLSLFIFSLKVFAQ